MLRLRASIRSTTFSAVGRAFAAIGLSMITKGLQSINLVENSSEMCGVMLLLLGCGDWPSSIMTFDGNPKPVQFIQPNVLDFACLSVGKHDGFADQFGLRRTVLIQNF